MARSAILFSTETVRKTFVLIYLMDYYILHYIRDSVSSLYFLSKDMSRRCFHLKTLIHLVSGMGYKRHGISSNEPKPNTSRLGQAFTSCRC